MSNDAEEVGRFSLPFDGGRPVLICGHPGSGKTSLIRHLITGLANRTVMVIATSGDRFDFPGRHVYALRPEDETTDASFFRHAEQLVRSTIETPGAVLVVDDFSPLAAPYTTPMPEQESFRNTLEAAIRVAHIKGVRVILTASEVPEKRLRDYCGAQFWVGLATPVDWVLMFGNAPLVPSPALLGAGVLALDGGFTPFRFPHLPEDQDGATPEAPEPTRKHRGFLGRR